MSSLEDLEARVTALEHKVSQTQSDAAAARVLAGAADRDVSEFRQIQNAHTRVLNAIREDQIEHGERLGSLEGRFDGLEAEMKSGFTKINIAVGQMATLLQHVADKIDEDDAS